MLFQRLYDEPTGLPEGSGNLPAVTPPASPAFDASAFETKILGEFDKRVNALDKRLKGLDTGVSTVSKGFDSFKAELLSHLKPAETKPHEEPVINPANPAAPPQEPAKPAQTSPTELAQQRELKEMREQLARIKDEAEKTKKEAAVEKLQSSLKSEISKHSFASPTGQNDLFALLSGNVQRGDDGNYYGPEGVLLEEYVRNEYTSRPNWHPVKNVNGSGAGPANPASSGGSRVFDMDSIKPGMSKEERQKAWQTVKQYQSIT